MKIMMSICAAAIAICGTLSAQSVDQIKVHFSTPVEVGASTIAAGDCSIQVYRGSTVILALRPQTGPVVSIAVNRLNEPNSSAEESKSTQVILSRHGDDYRLEKIVMPDRTGFEVPGSEQ